LQTAREASPVRYDLLKILIVDDNQNMRLLAEMLRAVGVQTILEASDGAQGLKMLRAHAIDVVMTDLSIRPMDGVEFVHLLRTSPESPNPMIPVIMITGHSTLLHVNEARNVGVNEFLTKPLTARGVLERLHQSINQQRPFISVATYSGPDRRRRADPNYNGPCRRAEDVDWIEA